MRTLVRLGAALVLLLIVVAPALFADVGDGGPTGSPDPVTISDYTATYEVDQDGTLTAKETITAEFPSGRHGIFRYWDVADAKDNGVRYEPRNIEITMDGDNIPYSMEWEKGRRFRLAKIGDPDSTLNSGTHVFQIDYEVDGVLAPTDKGSHFEWQVVAAGWSMRIDKTNILVTLPHTTEKFACRVGNAEECTQVADDDTTLRITESKLKRNTPIRVAADMSEAAPDRAHLPWGVQWDGVLGRSITAAGVFLILSVLALIYGNVLDRRSRETTPGLPVMFEPPEGLGPVQTHFITTETLTSHAVAATVMHLAEQGVVELTQPTSRSWTITSLTDAAGWSQLDPIARDVGTALGLTSVGASFAVDGSVTSGKVMGDLSSTFSSSATDWAREAGHLVRSGSEVRNRILVIVAVVLFGAGVFFGITSIRVLPFGMFALGGLGLFAAGVGWRRTKTGRDLWSRAGGFERLLSTPSAEDRFDFSARKDLYTSYIPYAIAFGAAELWAQKYRSQLGAEPPVPTWLPVTAGYGTGAAFASINSFDQAVSSSISSYQATQSSSSGGGGGFSGGGGGGGGGGSW